jgi:hypothetical protein
MFFAIFLMFLTTAQCDIGLLYNRLVAVPIERESYIPGYEINAAFRNDQSKSKVFQATMKFQTSRPTLNLINFIHIKDIKCDQNTTELHFDGNENASEAYKKWSKTKDLALIVSQNYGCDGPNIAFMGAKQLSLDGSVLRVLSTRLQAMDVIDDFELGISKFSNEKSRMVESYKGKEMGIVPLNLNYNPDTGNVTQSETSLIENQFAKFDCVDCYTRGEAKLRVLITGSIRQIRTYRIELDGGVTATMGLRGSIKIPGSQPLFMATLFSLALNPIQVPGIFKFGPEFRIKAGIDYGSSTETSVSTGFEVDYPFSCQISSNDGVFTSPNITCNGTPTPKARPFTLSKGNISINAHLIPEIAFDAEIVTAKLNVGISMDNVLGAEASFVENCNEAPFQVLLFHSHIASANARVLNETYIVPLLDTGRKPLSCIFCDKCNDIKPEPSSAFIVTPLFITTLLSFVLNF